MKPSLLLAVCLFAGNCVSAEWFPVFYPDFAQNFVGEGADQFNYVGSALEGEFVEFAGAAEGRFRMVTKHAPTSERNHSITRLSRHGNAGPASSLDIGRGVVLLRLQFRWKPKAWIPMARNVLDIQIGENFRSGTYNPARGGRQPDGPAFAALQLQAQPEEDRFRIVLGSSDTGSAPFQHQKDAEGFHTLQLAFAYNNTEEEVSVTAPGGAYTLKAGRLAVWIGNELLWDNVTDARHIRDAAFQHISFGFGNGTDRPFEEAEAWAGIYEIDDISVQKWAP